MIYDPFDVAQDSFTIVPAFAGMTILFLCELCASVANTLFEKTNPICRQLE